MVFQKVWGSTRKKVPPNRYARRPTTAFRIDPEHQGYLKQLTTLNAKSRFINRAISFYRMFLNDPKELMIELRKRNPELWKYVNRKKFYKGGKFL